MSSIINFTPLYGVDGDAPLCSLLRVDEYTILLDCGWTCDFDETLLLPLKSVIADIDAVLISHCDLAHIGALPYAIGKLGLSAPVYCTLPIYKMGQMSIYDTLLSLVPYHFNVFSFDDVDTAFERMIQMKYSQEVTLAGKSSSSGGGNENVSNSVTVTPFPAGHTIGGTIWRIAKEGDSILYAVDINHSRERHLNGGVLETFSRPTVLICDAYNALTTVTPRKSRDQELMKHIHDTCLKQGGSVLLPVDSATRVLEILLLLHHYWEIQKLNKGSNPVQLVFLSYQSYNIVEFARSMIEWMSESCMKSFDLNRENPYKFPQLHICHTIAEVKSIPKPFVVMASNEILSTSHSLELFEWMSDDKRNEVVFTQRTAKSTVANELMQQPTPREIVIPKRVKVKLVGEELDEYLEKQRIATEQAALESKAQVAEDSDSDTEDNVVGVGADSMIDTPTRNSSSSGSSSSASKRRGSGPASVHVSSGSAISGSSKSTKHLMYSYYEPKRTWDIYGEVIDLKHLGRSTTAHLEAAAAAAANKQDSKMSDHPDSLSLTSSSTLNQSAAAVAAAKKSSSSSTSSAVSSTPEVPTKTVIEYTTVPVHCRVAYIDLEGRSDAKSMKNILSHVRPRKLIVMHGSEAGKQELQRYATKEDLTPRDGIYIPKLNQCIDITSESNIYRLQLHSSLLANLRFVTVGEYDVAYTEAQIKLSQQQQQIQQQQQTSQQRLSSASTSAGLPSLHALDDRREVRGHAAVFLGDFRFTELKRLLSENGISCEFYGGILVCQGGLINIRKLGPTQISIQGAVSEDYYKIRGLLYSRYTIV